MFDRLWWCGKSGNLGNDLLLWCWITGSWRDGMSWIMMSQWSVVYWSLVAISRSHQSRSQLLCQHRRLATESVVMTLSSYPSIMHQYSLQPVDNSSTTKYRHVNFSRWYRFGILIHVYFPLTKYLIPPAYLIFINPYLSGMRINQEDRWKMAPHLYLSNHIRPKLVFKPLLGAIGKHQKYYRQLIYCI